MFMDDTVLPVLAASATELLCRVAQVARLAIVVCKRHGLKVNFSPGKTEALFLSSRTWCTAWSGTAAPALVLILMVLWCLCSYLVVRMTRFCALWRHIGTLASCPIRVRACRWRSRLGAGKLTPRMRK